jgi:hypothetical protein
MGAVALGIVGAAFGMPLLGLMVGAVIGGAAGAMGGVVEPGGSSDSSSPPATGAGSGPDKPEVVTVDFK